MNASGAKIKIGAVSYLNTRPLVYGLPGAAADQIQLVFDLPSRLADQLAAKRLDVALIPSVEYLRNPDYQIVSDACIACRGPVMSVKLFSRVPLNEIRTLALDEGSRTSAVMVQILLDQLYCIKPRLLPLPIGDGLHSSSADGVLLIGDRAIGADHSGFEVVWDVGDRWVRHFEQPFVFAVWAAHGAAALGDVATMLEMARDRGIADLEAIAAAECVNVGLSQRDCLAYLRDNLYFHLGAPERRGLKLFTQIAARGGYLPEEIERQTDDCTIA